MGLFEGLIAILIVFGDCWGGFLLFVNLLVSGAFDYQDICSIVQWDVNRQLEVNLYDEWKFARYVFFVGASLALMACSKKACKTSCPEKVQSESKSSSKKWKEKVREKICSTYILQKIFHRIFNGKF